MANRSFPCPVARLQHVCRNQSPPSVFKELLPVSPGCHRYPLATGYIRCCGRHRRSSKRITTKFKSERAGRYSGKVTVGWGIEFHNSFIFYSIVKELCRATIIHRNRIQIFWIPPSPSTEMPPLRTILLTPKTKNSTSPFQTRA